MKRLPKQERSKQIVDSVLEGATRILAKVRLKDASTNKIAEMAGVGIGSLYDYFQNKEAIAVSLIDRHINEVLQDFHILLEEGPEKTLDTKIDEIMLFMNTKFITRKNFLREIFFLAPASGRMETLYLARERTTTSMAKFLMARFPSMTEERALQKSFFLVHGVISLTDSYIILDAPYFTPESLTADLKSFIYACLANDTQPLST